MSKSIERFIAWRYLRSPRQEGFVAVIAWFSFLGIFLGVATLIIVMSVMNGFRHELRDRILGLNGHLTLYAQSGHEGALDLPRLSKFSGVLSVTPLLEKQGLCITHSGATGTMIRGLNPEDLKKRTLVAKNFIQGGLSRFGEANTVVVGSKFARKLGIRLGDSIKIMAAEGRHTAFGTLPRTRHFQVVGIFESGMYEYDSAFVFMPLSSAQQFFETPKVAGVEIFMKDPDRLGPIKQYLSSLQGVYFHDWQEANGHFFNAIQVQRNVMFLILTLIVLVAVFNIVSCLVMLVKDKTKDIAVLRTLGATRSMIMRVFFYTGAFIGVLGTAAGTLLGLGFSYNIEAIRQILEKMSGIELFQAEIYFLSKLPSRVDLHEVSAVVLMALGFSFIATIYPAWRASRLNPVEGLRYE
jgi:lipoprotein-releasing system permease protein